MRKVITPDESTIDRASHIGNAAVMAACDKIIEELNCSGISALSIALQCAMNGLMQIGGPDAGTYVVICAKEAKKGRHTQQTVEQRRKAFESMAQYSDFIVAQAGGSA